MSDAVLQALLSGSNIFSCDLDPRFTRPFRSIAQCGFDNIIRTAAPVLDIRHYGFFTLDAHVDYIVDLSLLPVIGKKVETFVSWITQFIV